MVTSDAATMYGQFASSHLSLNDLDCANCALELISVRDGAFTLNGFSSDDVDEMISLLLTG